MAQISFTRGGVEFTVFTDDDESPVEKTKVLAADAPEFFKLVNDIDQGARAADVFAARESTATKDVPVNQSAPPSTETPTCPHGTMNDLIDGKTREGKPYKFRYYCASMDKNNKCNPAGKVPNPNYVD
jgi:hypothetical protein